MLCEKCGKFFLEDYRKDKKQRKKPIRFCSKSCSNGKKHSEETKKKISNTLLINNSHYKFATKQKYEKICPVCSKHFFVFPCYLGKVYCSRKCYREDSKHLHRKCNAGGIREGSGFSKSGTYKGFYCGSTWELCYYIYNLNTGKNIDRCKDFYLYEDGNGKLRRYYPDFIVEDKIVEIKGPQDKLWEYKLKAFPEKEKLIVLYKNEIKFYLDYVKEKYGKKPEELFDVKCII